MLYNIAQAYRLADQPGEAVRYYRRFLQRMPNAKNRDDVERKIADRRSSPSSAGRSSRSRRRHRPSRRRSWRSTPPVAPPVTPPPPLPPPPPPPETSHAGAVVGWSLLAAGVIADGVAGYEAYRAKQKADQLSKDSMMNGTKTFDPALETAGKNANIAAIALGIGGTAVAITGIIVLVTGDSSSSEQTEKRQRRLRA